jgi:hypothetical protein
MVLSLRRDIKGPMSAPPTRAELIFLARDYGLMRARNDAGPHYGSLQRASIWI